MRFVYIRNLEPETSIPKCRGEEGNGRGTGTHSMDWRDTSDRDPTINITMKKYQRYQSICPLTYTVLTVLRSGFISSLIKKMRQKINRL